MKLLFFIPSLSGGGAERVLSLITNQLALRGHEVHVAYNKNRPQAYKLNQNIITHDLSYKKTKNYFLNKITNPFKLIRKIRKITEEVKPELVISFMYSLTFYVTLALKRTSYPIISSEHTTFIRKIGLKDKILRTIGSKNADIIFVLTYYDKAYIFNKYCNIKVMPNPNTSVPITFAEFDAIDNQRKNNILGCGRITEDKIKGFDNLIRSFALIADKFPDVDLDIAGTGPIKSINFLKELAKKLSVSSRVHFLGFQNDIESLYKSHKIFAFSSRYEGFGMALIEAMANGCAVISFDLIAGPAEIINDGIDGLIVENQNVKALAEGFDKVLANDEYRKFLAKNAIINISRYNKEKITDKWEEVFNQTIKSK